MGWLPGKNAMTFLQVLCHLSYNSALEQVALGNHVLQGAAGIREKIVVGWVVVCKRYLIVFVPVPTVEFSAGVAEQTFTQGLLAHEPGKPRRDATKIIGTVAGRQSLTAGIQLRFLVRVSHSSPARLLRRVATG